MASNCSSDTKAGKNCNDCNDYTPIGECHALEPPRFTGKCAATGKRGSFRGIRGRMSFCPLK